MSFLHRTELPEWKSVLLCTATEQGSLQGTYFSVLLPITASFSRHITGELKQRVWQEPGQARNDPQIMPRWSQDPKLSPLARLHRK